MRLFCRSAAVGAKSALERIAAILAVHRFFPLIILILMRAPRKAVSTIKIAETNLKHKQFPFHRAFVRKKPEFRLCFVYKARRKRARFIWT